MAKVSGSFRDSLTLMVYPFNDRSKDQRSVIIDFSHKVQQYPEYVPVATYDDDYKAGQEWYKIQN
jgi:hypothetical protein